MPVSMDNSSEDFWVQFYDGSNWQIVADYDKGADFQNNQFYHAQVIINESEYNFSTNANIKFTCDASANGDDVYIDEIRITAYDPLPAGGGGGGGGGGEPEEVCLWQIAGDCSAPSGDECCPEGMACCTCDEGAACPKYYYHPATDTSKITVISNTEGYGDWEVIMKFYHGFASGTKTGITFWYQNIYNYAQVTWEKGPGIFRIEGMRDGSYYFTQMDLGGSGLGYADEDWLYMYVKFNSVGLYAHVWPGSDGPDNHPVPSAMFFHPPMQKGSNSNAYDTLHSLGEEGGYIGLYADGEAIIDEIIVQ